MPLRRLVMLYLPSLSVLPSCFAPCSLTASTVKPAQGFPLISRICPLTDPVWAAALGANTETSAATRIAASPTDLLKIFMLHSPFVREPLRNLRRLFACLPQAGPIISLVPAGFQVCLLAASPACGWQLSQAPQAQRPAETTRRYGIASVAPASVNARNRSKQLSQAPQAASSS